MEPRYIIAFQPEGLRTEVAKDESVLIASQRCGIHIDALCSGRGKCGKCVIRVGHGEVTPPTPSEMGVLSKAEIEGGIRLACQTYPASDLIIHVPNASRPVSSKILTWGLELPITLNPYLRAMSRELDMPTLQDQRSDEERLRKALKCRSVDLQLLRRLPRLLRKGDWRISATIYRDEIIDLGGDGLYGAAADVGTTTIVVYLIDLVSGNVVAVESDYNAQIPYGEDVISRIAYTTREKDGLGLLQKLVVETLNKLVTRAAEQAKVDKERVYEIVCAGNTIMTSILLGIDPSSIATAPYVPPVTGMIKVKAREVGVEMGQGGYLRTIPSISGYVGADVVADVLVSGLHRREGVSLLIDIGTNGEVVLGNRHGMLAASCAAGPALEGAEIAFGMRGMAGAIEKAAIRPDTYEVFYQTIGGGKPRGICGSGLVDALSSLAITGLVDRTGRMRSGQQQTAGRSQVEFVLAKASETAIGKDITITQRDVRNLQLAKSAIYTGCSILMKMTNAKPDDLKNVFIAGAFGNYIDPVSAIVIGMFPDVPIGRIKSIGNGAGFGARLALLSRAKSAEAERITRRIRYVELSAEKDFQQEFLKALNLPHAEPSLFPTATRIIESGGRERPEAALEDGRAKH
jgi:uncharacterized 2Fe-2S/4Fe-4S cluster protein (DUF4445 family)